MAPLGSPENPNPSRSPKKIDLQYRFFCQSVIFAPILAPGPSDTLGMIKNVPFTIGMIKNAPFTLGMTKNGPFTLGVIKNAPFILGVTKTTRSP